jgi:transcriptional regulator with XRE-family HTH domain
MKNNLFQPLRTHRLKSLLKVNGIRQSQAANKLDVSLAYLNLVLNGHVRPSKKLATGIEKLTLQMDDTTLGKESSNGR